MKLDTYTKVVLTGIAVFLGVIAFDYRPNMEAKAGIMGGGEMIIQTEYMKQLDTFIHMKDGKFRACSVRTDRNLPYTNIMSQYVFECSPFSSGFSK